MLSLAGRYDVERELARGGVAAVYLATDRRHGRRVALKVLDPDIVGAVGSDRFLREIEIAARLTHPHIVPLFDSGRAAWEQQDGPGVLFYVMPFIAGETLRQRVDRDGALPLADAIRIAREVASALDYAHRAGVIHRDIKPENILLSEGHAVVTDFGIARAVLHAATQATLTQIGMVVGTPAYMSPEQAAGSDQIGAQTDQYSLACVIFELLSGRPPFRGSSAMALLAQHLTAPPPPLRTPIPVGAHVERGLQRALAKDPLERFESATVFVEAIAQDSLTAAPVSTRLPVAGGARRSSAIPVPITPLVGRENDVRTVLALLQRDGVRLLTLFGPGGVGKTRLALEVASRAEHLFPDGVYFVPLAEVRDAPTMEARIAHSVGVRSAGDASIADALRTYLDGRRALIVLDNFEQLLDAAPRVSALLTHCRDVRTIVTSQALLRVYGEHELGVEPLAVADAHLASQPRVAAESPAVRLFMDRAVAARSSFVIDDSNAASVISICASLDGVPLAIELAAARMKSMTPDAVLAKLRTSLEVLTGGARDLPDRQRTMRGAIAWCYDLLHDDERALFRRLAAFAGGATLPAAAAVCGDGGDGRIDELLASLVDHSLLRQHTDAAGETRFTMLRPIHAFAADVLAAAGEADAVADAHAAHFRDVALAAEPDLVRGSDEWLDRLDVERDNLRVALDRLVARHMVADALRTAIAVWRFWDARSYAREGVEAFTRILSAPAPEVPVRLRVSALYAAGVLADSCGDYATAKGLFEQHLAQTSQLGDPRAASVSTNNLAVLLVRQGDYDAAIPLIQSAVTALRDAGDLRAAGIGVANLGNAERLRRNFSAAGSHYHEALEIFRAMGDGTNQGWALSHLGDLARDEGDRGTARQRYREGLAAFSELKYKRGMAAVLIDLAELSVLDENLIDARALLEEALAHVADAGDQRGMIRVFEVLAGVFAAGGRSERAVRLAGAVGGLRDRLGAPLSKTERVRLEARVSVAVGQLGEHASASLWRDGWDLSIEDVLRDLTTPDAHTDAAPV